MGIHGLKKRFNRPFYKQFIKLRKNIQNRPKVFKFKRKKWNNFQFHTRLQLRFFRRYRFRDQFRNAVKKFASRGNSFQKKFRNNLHRRKLFSVFYGSLRWKNIKKVINCIKKRKTKDFRQELLKVFESRLDTVIHRSRFSYSMKSSKQLIFHGHILVNGVTVRTPSYILKTGDFIEVAKNLKSRDLVSKHIDKSNFWPIPPKHVVPNYLTLQIIFLYDKNLSIKPHFSYYLNVGSMITNIKQY